MAATFPAAPFAQAPRVARLDTVARLKQNDPAVSRRVVPRSSARLRRRDGGRSLRVALLRVLAETEDQLLALRLRADLDLLAEADDRARRLGRDLAQDQLAEAGQDGADRGEVEEGVGQLFDEGSGLLLADVAQAVARDGGGEVGDELALGVTLLARLREGRGGGLLGGALLGRECGFGFGHAFFS